MEDYTLIVPVLNKPEMLMTLLNSISEEEIPERLLIIYNGGRPPHDPIPIHWTKTTSLILYANENLGVAGSWNAGVKLTSPPWIVSNFDIVFSDGSIKEFLFPLKNGYDLVTLTQGYCLWGANQSLFDRVGYFDENFYPAYVEDLDFDTRVQRYNYEYKDIYGDRMKKASLNIPGITHYQSSTLRGHYGAPLGDALNTLKMMSEKYYVKKWGGEFGSERYALPFKTYPLNYWERDEEELKIKKEIFLKGFTR